MPDVADAYWEAFYGSRKAADFPTPFAEFCLAKYIGPDAKLLELGCGNGRDAFHFAKNGVSVVALDQSEAAIAAGSARLDSAAPAGRLCFKKADFAEMERHCLAGTGIIYSRFTLHAIPEEAENRVLSKAYELLPDKGLFLIEVRTIHDALFGKGKKIGEREYVTDHYRRFIDSSLFLEKCLRLRWRIRYFVEEKGLAVYKGEDPVVARFVLMKG